MNRTIKEVTVKRFHYDCHDQLRTHLVDFIAAYNFARRLKTLSGLTPYEYICKIWTSEPERFTVNPIHQMPGLNTKMLECSWVSGTLGESVTALLLLDCATKNGAPVLPPFRQTTLEPAGIHAMLAQCRDRLMCIDAVRTAAIGNDLLFMIEI